MTVDNNNKPYQKQYRGSSLGPSVVILVIAVIVFLTFNNSGSDASERNSSDSSLSATAFLGGSERYNNSPSFRRGDASAIMGGVQLDLRDAVMEGNRATLEVSAIMGGIDIRVPRDWTVVNHVTPILGAVKDTTRSGDANKKLFLEGTVLMGGLEIKN
jgi:predicted membrane protein